MIYIKRNMEKIIKEVSRVYPVLIYNENNQLLQTFKKNSKLI